jgi:hypothetical protein
MRDLDETFREFALAFIGKTSVDRDIAMPRRLLRAALDGRHGGLKVVDEYLTQLHERHQEIAEAEWHTTVLWAGAYVGEVIRAETRKYCRWTDYNDYMPLHPKLQGLIPERTTPTCAFLVGPDDYMSMPLNKIARFIDDGPENSTHYFASCDIAVARRAG